MTVSALAVVISFTLKMIVPHMTFQNFPMLRSSLLIIPVLLRVLSLNVCPGLNVSYILTQIVQLLAIMMVLALFTFAMSRKKMDFNQPFCGVRVAEWMSISQAFYRLNLPLRSPVNFSPEEYTEFNSLLGVVQCAIIRLNNLDYLPIKYKFELMAKQIDQPYLFDIRSEEKDDLPF